MVKRIESVPSFIAGDLTEIRELLHPANDSIELNYSLAHASLPVGKASLPHRLVKSSETYFILEGEGKMYIDEDSFFVRTGDTVFIPANALQWIENTGKQILSFICIVSPPWAASDEVIESRS